MGTIFAVVGSNLTVTYFEVKMFALLPQIYPRGMFYIELQVFVQKTANKYKNFWSLLHWFHFSPF